MMQRKHEGMMVEIKIKKINAISRSEFIELIKDPKTHLQFLRQRLSFHSVDNINDIIDEVNSAVTDVYYVDILSPDNTCIIYFWSVTDFSNFRR